MADTLASGSASAPRRPLTSSPRPLSWVKRRARSIERAFVVPRRVAILNARIDWAHFHPITA